MQIAMPLLQCLYGGHGQWYIFFLPINNINYYNLPVTDTMFASGLNDSVKSESSFAIAYQTNYQKTKLMLWQGKTSTLLAGIKVN